MWIVFSGGFYFDVLRLILRNLFYVCLTMRFPVLFLRMCLLLWKTFSSCFLLYFYLWSVISSWHLHGIVLMIVKLRRLFQFSFIIRVIWIDVVFLDSLWSILLQMWIICYWLSFLRMRKFLILTLWSSIHTIIPALIVNICLT